jgi:hypothetical protein
MGSLTRPISPFDENTRQNLRDIPAITIAGSRNQAVLPKTGFLARVHCHASGVLTVTLGGGTAALDVLGPWNLFNRVRVAINGGKEVFSASGNGAHIVDGNSSRKYIPQDSGWKTDPAHAALVYAAPTSAGANNWEFGFTIPIAPNDDEMLGGFIVQTEAAQSTLTFDFNQSIYSTSATVAPVLVTGAATATFTGSITPLVETFDIPADRSLWPPVQALHIINENSYPIGQTGDLYVDLLKDNVYLQIYKYIILNSAPTSMSFDRSKLIIQRNIFPYDYPQKSLLQLQRYRYGRDLEAGVLLDDFFYQGHPNYGSFRDAINAMDLTEFQNDVLISSGATLGSVAQVRVISRMLEPLEQAQVRMG